MSLLTAQVERLSDHFDEWSAHHETHWTELALDKARAPLAVRFDAYKAMDDLGHIVFVTLREDGRMVHEMYLFELKKPSESKGEWDLYKMLAKVPGDEAFRPLDEGGCPLVKK